MCVKNYFPVIAKGKIMKRASSLSLILIVGSITTLVSYAQEPISMPTSPLTTSVMDLEEVEPKSSKQTEAIHEIPKAKEIKDIPAPESSGTAKLLVKKSSENSKPESKVPMIPARKEEQPKEKTTILPKESSKQEIIAKPKENITVKTTEAKIDAPKITPKPTATPKKNILVKFEKLQRELIDVIREAKEYTDTDKKSMGEFLEPISIILGISLGGFEEISGEKLLPEVPEEEPLVTPSPTPVKTKKVTRPTKKEPIKSEQPKKKAPRQRPLKKKVVTPTSESENEEVVTPETL
jgi:hypothetical protein